MNFPNKWTIYESEINNYDQNFTIRNKL